MNLLVPNLLLACSEDSASVAVARAFEALQDKNEKKQRQMNVLVEPSKLICEALNYDLRAGRCVLLIDHKMCRSLRFVGLSRPYGLRAQPYLVGVGHSVLSPTREPLRTHCAEMIAAMFSEQRILFAREQQVQPWMARNTRPDKKSTASAQMSDQTLSRAAE